MSALSRSLGLGALACALALSVASAARAGPSAQDLARVLKLDEVVGILRQEGLDYAETIEDDMLGGSGGQLWRSKVEALYSAERMAAVLTEAMEDGMNTAEIAEAAAFFGTETGQGILTFENAARRAMAEEDVEEIARLRVEELRAAGDARLAQVDRFMAVNDLVERNVAGALGSNYQFFRGLADGGALDLTEGDIIADVWGQEAELRAETEGWLTAFLTMAYAPLGDDAMQSYIDFSGTEGGRALNAALFEGFDVMYRDISYALGRMVAQSMGGSDL
ncbi:MAG: DUF2059 domain-containing protein [Rhodobacteraceae bacterium]|nr:MAG: DUF2059 domain-containing protein [Paracoccaceae bacterium]